MPCMQGASDSELFAAAFAFCCVQGGAASAACSEAQGSGLHECANCWQPCPLCTPRCVKHAHACVGEGAARTWVGGGGKDM